MAALSGGVYDGTHLFVMGNATTTGGTWKKNTTGTWTEIGGTTTPRSIRALDPATGNLIQIGGRPFELPLPSNPLGPCSLNTSAQLVCAGGTVHLPQATTTACSSSTRHGGPQCYATSKTSRTIRSSPNPYRPRARSSPPTPRNS